MTREQVAEVQKQFAVALKAGQITTDGFRWNTTSDTLNATIKNATKVA